MLVLVAWSSQAKLGETWAQMEARYGEPVDTLRAGYGTFRFNDLFVFVHLGRAGTVNLEIFSRTNYTKTINGEMARVLGSVRTDFISLDEAMQLATAASGQTNWVEINTLFSESAVREWRTENGTRMSWRKDGSFVSVKTSNFLAEIEEDRLARQIKVQQELKAEAESAAKELKERFGIGNGKPTPVQPLPKE